MPIKHLIVGLLVCASCTVVRSAELTIDEQNIEFGEKYQFEDLLRDVRVWNRSQKVVSIREVKQADGVSLAPEKMLVEPGQSTVLHIRADLRNRSGAVSIAAPFETVEGSKVERQQVVLTGFIESIFDDPKLSIDFGVVATTAPVNKSLRLQSQSFPSFRIARVLETPDFLSARVGDDGQTLLVSPKKFDVLGYSKGVVKLALAAAPQKEAWVVVVMDLHGDVVPDQNPLDFGLQRRSSAQPLRLQLTSRTGKPVHIGKISMDDSTQMSVEETDCLPKARPDCKGYMIGIQPNHVYGVISGKIGFDLPDMHQVLNVHVGGVYLSDSTKVRSLNDPANSESQSKGQTEAVRSTDLTQSLKKAVEDKANVAPPGTGPLLKWQVANEAGIYGYAIYRGDSPDGKFTRVNDQIVKADNGGDNTTASYQWRDTSAVKGHEYWYYITIFNNNGKKTQLTGPQKVVAK